MFNHSRQTAARMPTDFRALRAYYMVQARRCDLPSNRQYYVDAAHRCNRWVVENHKLARLLNTTTGSMDT
jgi:hypothetical protein